MLGSGWSSEEAVDDKTAHGRLKVGITYQKHLRRIVEHNFSVLAVVRPGRQQADT